MAIKRISLSAIALTTLGLGCASMAHAQAQPVVYGSVVFGHGWEDMEKAPYGIYSMPANDGSKIAPVKLDDKLTAFGGGVYVDGRYYMVDYTPYNYDGTVSFRIYDVENGWKLLSEKKLTTYSSVASDLAYDPVGDKIYGCFRVDPKDNKYFFGTLNTATGFSSKISDLKEELIALASTRDGKLYGIGLYGMLYSIDKQTGSLTEIGQTGKTVKYAQSATFDYPSGRMLWAMTPHYTDESPELCELDLATGKATTLATIPDRYQFTGIFTKGSYAVDGAPSSPQKPSVEFSQASLTGNVVFTMPTTTMAGAKLSGNLDYQVKIDGEPLFNGSSTAGAAVSEPATVERGMHTLKITASNVTGRSPFVYCDFWAGNDVVTPLSPKAEKNGDKVSVVWTAPQQGDHGGYFNPQTVTYTVTRQPGSKEVYTGSATSFVDDVADIQYGNYYYEVKASHAGEYGGTAKTNTLQLGTSLQLPYDQAFDSEDEVSSLMADDVNGDDNTWSFFGDCMMYTISESGLDADDWLITPAFSMSKDKVYYVSLEAMADQGCTEKFEVAAGNFPKGKSLTQQIIPVTEVSTDESKTFSGTFIPAEDGACYIGIHACSTYADGSSLYIDNLHVEELGSTKAPAAVFDVKATAEGAEHKVKISFAAPFADMAGSELTGNISKISVTRLSDNALVKTFRDVIPGALKSFEDTPQIDGMVEYRIVAENEYGSGAPVSVETYVGYDTPAAVTGGKVTATDDGKVVATWNAPMAGIHGGTIDMTSLKYNIGNVNGSSLRSAVVTEPSFSEQLTMKEGEQRLAWYTITPETAQGKGVDASTDTVFVGKPYALPYAESFAKRSLERGPWCPYDSDVAEWYLMQLGTYAEAYDGDGGMISFATVTEGARASFVGPKVSLKNANHPVLKFFVFNMKNCCHSLNVEVITPDGKRHTVGSFVPNNTELDGMNGEWQEKKYDLSAFRSYDYVQLSFTGVGGHAEDLAAIKPFYVDAISINDVKENDLSLADAYTLTEKAQVGDEVPFNIYVENKGSGVAENFKVVLYRNDTPVNSITYRQLAAGKTAAISLADTLNSDAPQTCVYRAAIEWAADEDVANNTSANTVVTVLPGKPFIKSVCAKAGAGNSSVELSWNEPEGINNGTTAETVTEDFESYYPFSITNMGEWTLYDGDKSSTMGVLDGHGDYVQYDNVEAPKAYMVFNPSAAGINTALYPTHSGKQVAAAFCSGRVANDDWLISPEVDGAQTVKFWACSPDGAYYSTKEQLEVLYSTSGTETADFKKLGATITVPTQWQEFSANLPEGTRYFALRCVSNNQYILFLDDITYRKAARDFRLLGYNVYRNGELLTAAPVSTTSYVANVTADKNDNYSVSAVYNTGESRLTQAVWSGTDGIFSIDADGMAQDVVVYDLTGRKVEPSQIVRGGVYIVKQGGKTRKIAVK